MVLFWVMHISRRNFGKKMFAVGATALLASPSNAQLPQESKPNQSTEDKRSALTQGLQPIKSESETIKDWANSPNGILRSIFYQNDPFLKKLNELNSDIAKPLTFEGINKAFEERFNTSVQKLIKIDHELTDFDQASPYYVYLSKPVQWNSKGETRQLFRIVPRTMGYKNSDVQKNFDQIIENKFDVAQGGRLNRDDKAIAIKQLQSIKSGYWDLRSPYSGAQLAKNDDGSLNTLEFNLGIVNKPEEIQPRKIIFTGSDSTEIPKEAKNGIVEGPNKSVTAYLIPGQYTVITK